MNHKFGQDPIQRYENNPIITREHIPFPCNSVFNAAAARLGDVMQFCAVDKHM